MIRCKYCNSTNPSFDELTKMYYCDSCNRLLGEDEIIDETERSEQEVKDNIEEYEDSHNIKVLEEEPLNGFSLLILNIVMLIPILNIFVLFAIINSNVEYQYRKVFSYRFIAGIIILLLCIVAICSVSANRRYELVGNVHTILDKAVTFLADRQQPDIKVPNLESHDLFEIIESISPADSDNSVDVESTFTLSWDTIDGTQWTGSMLKDLFEQTGENYIFLIQTANIRDRYSNKSYRNVGLRCTGAVKDGDNENYFYEDSLTKPFEIYYDDYGEVVDFTTKDLYNKKYIYYLNPTNSYTLHILHDDNGSLIGFAMQEEIKEVTKKK